jgi:serine/threonine protein kinase
MDSKDSKGFGSGESEDPFSSDVVHTSGAVVQWPGQNQEVEPESCNLSSSSGSFSELDEDISTTASQSTELSDEFIPSVVAPLYSGIAPEHLWTELLPSRDPSPATAETANEEERFRLVRLIHPSELKIVEEIAKGGQARIFLAKYLGTRVVVKRYRCCGAGAVNLERQKEVALKLQREMEMVMKACKGTSKSRLCPVIGVSVDKTGKVLVVMQLMEGDLRTLIDKSVVELGHGRGTHLNKMRIMRAIASGIRELHACGRVHKDIKASNILVSSVYRRKPRIPLSRFHDVTSPWRRLGGKPGYGEELFFNHCDMFYDEFDVKIGDYESSDDVVGTGFWRPPEVLQALRDGSPSDLRLVYSPAVDVYGFGMVCYEILTGRIPFEGHYLSNYDLVLSGRRPDIPNHVPPLLRDLLHRCWHMDPHQRPGWPEILHILDILDGSSPTAWMAQDPR